MPAVAAVAFEVIADVPLGNRNQLNALRAAVKDPNWPTRKFVTPDAGISACRTASGWIVGNSEVMRNGIAAYSRLVAQRLPMFSAHFECSARITAHSERAQRGREPPGPESGRSPDTAGFLSRNPLRASERPGAFAVGGWRSRIEGWVSGSPISAARLPAGSQFRFRERRGWLRGCLGTSSPSRLAAA